MDHVTSYDQVRQICRACMKCDNMSTELSKLIDISNSGSQYSLADIFTICTALEVSNEDGLPTTVCHSCTKTLINLYEFRMQCQNNDLKLRNTFLNIEITTVGEECYNTYDEESDNTLHMKITAEILSKNDRNDSKSKYNNSSQNKEDSVYLKNKLDNHKHHNICHETETSKEIFLEHLTVQNKFECYQCLKTFKKENDFKKHMNTHASLMNKNILISKTMICKENNFCVECNQKFRSYNLFVSHMKIHNKILDAFCCKLCNETFTLKEDFHRHYLRHSIRDRAKIDKPYLCIYCSRSFKQLNSLSVHKRTHTEESPYLCSQCGKSFQSHSNLKQHLISHTELKPFACHLCPMKFNSKGSLTCHLQTHTGTKPWICDVCGNSFSHPSTLRKHRMNHEGIKPWKCDSCDKSFTVKEHLKRHIFVHTGEKPFKCKYCDKAFNQKFNLVVHTKSHVGDNLYQCTVCDMKFRLSSELKKHYPTHYKEGTMETYVRSEEELNV